MENHKRKSQCNEITYKKLSRNLIFGCSYYLRQGSFFTTSPLNGVQKLASAVIRPTKRKI
ncbi:hypothetical protein DVX38_01905 [Enterococcus faecium]|nr:hypothetical protein CUN19_00675 [Enterococcus faecium]PQB93443.1 hypothetical protein CUN11_03935 [Enterococcus faecium]PQB98794.1 hypothetical protein CUN20_08955 [Enterococcus faecium]PQF12657.1 hypothetical protein CUS96_11550 [Enterococcus faecium]PQF54793.1 hypothetical protein CUS70_03405 [Enterococcus faecium]